MIPEHNTHQHFSYLEKSLATFIAFLERIKLKSAIIKSIHDPRSGPIDYPLSSIITSALAIVFFRLQSKNSFKTLSHILTANPESLATIFQNNIKKIPDTKTTDDVLSKLSINEFNELNFKLFEQLLRSKFFLNHRKLIPDLTFRIGIDGEVVHTYSSDSSHNPEQCPYCLKRKHRKGKVNYQHIDIVASIVCPGKIKFPIFSYRVHAISPDEKLDLESLSEQKFKQECEQKALPHILGAIRKRFPRLKFHVLLDGLYANSSVIKIIEKNRMDFSIVFKKKTTFQHQKQLPRD